MWALKFWANFNFSTNLELFAEKSSEHQEWLAGKLFLVTFVENSLRKLKYHEIIIFLLLTLMACVLMMDRKIWAIFLLIFSATSINHIKLIKFAIIFILKINIVLGYMDEPLFGPLLVCVLTRCIWSGNPRPLTHFRDALGQN